MWSSHHEAATRCAGRGVGSRLAVLGYRVVRREGGHLRLTTEVGGTHHVTLIAGLLKVGTFHRILTEVATHHGLSRDEVLARLFPE